MKPRTILVILLSNLSVLFENRFADFKPCPRGASDYLGLPFLELSWRFVVVGDFWKSLSRVSDKMIGEEWKQKRSEKRSGRNLRDRGDGKGCQMEI
jgi:hypothetical protein